MKKPILFCHLIIFLLSFFDTQAQKSRNHELIKIDTIKNNYYISSIFEEYRCLDSITISFENNNITNVFLYDKSISNKGVNYIFFDLLYEADSVFFSKKYKTIKENLESYLIDYWAKKNMDDKAHLSLIKFDDKRTRSILSYNTQTYGDSRKILGWPAYFGKDIAQLESCIEFKLTATNLSNFQPSTLVYDCLISKNDKLVELELIAGEPSFFSQVVDECIMSNSSFWKAGVLETSGLRRDTRIRILVRVNSNKTITIKTPKKLNTINGY